MLLKMESTDDTPSVQFSSVAQSCPTLQPHESQRFHIIHSVFQRDCWSANLSGDPAQMQSEFLQFFSPIVIYKLFIKGVWKFKGLRIAQQKGWRREGGRQREETRNTSSRQSDVTFICCCCSVAHSCSALCHPHGLQHSRLPCLHCLLEFAQNPVH